MVDCDVMYFNDQPVWYDEWLVVIMMLSIFVRFCHL